MNATAKIEYGDFQTPPELCAQVCETLIKLRVNPKTVIEPTCGLGNFIKAADNHFTEVKRIIGLEINKAYFSNIGSQRFKARTDIINGSFFTFEWEEFVAASSEPILFLGNPPWVTNSELSSLGSDNLPEKQNFKGLRGFDALTGKSNFDVSEWMILKLVQLLQKKSGVVAMLCKTSVARHALAYLWKHGSYVSEAKIYLIDAKKHFNVSADACLLVITVDSSATNSNNCLVFDSLQAPTPCQNIGFINGGLVSNIDDYNALKYLRTLNDSAFKWRSGIKHDCSKIMELECVGAGLYVNGLGEQVVLESTFLYPMLKSSDIGNGSLRPPRKYMLVTQMNVGDSTDKIKDIAPRTWNYLLANRHLLDARKSTIYKKNPPFSIFGVGEYSFAPWKVAISGFYKRTHFKVIPPHNKTPVVVDDTIYFLPCGSEKEATHLAFLLNTPEAQRYLNSLIFMDAKRPVTTDLLNKLNIEALMKKNPISKNNASHSITKSIAALQNSAA